PRAAFTCTESTVVMAGHSRPKDGVATLAYVPAIHVLLWCQGVDARDKRGHDGGDWRKLCGKCAKRCHCEPTGPAFGRPDDRLREAIPLRARPRGGDCFVALARSSQ